MLATVAGAGWEVEDFPSRGVLAPTMPHLARLSRRGAPLYVNAWRDRPDAPTLVTAVLQP